MKRCLALVLSLVLILTAAWIPSVGTKVEAASFTDLNQSQITAEMGLGWNLGNQLEANSNGTPSETAWGNPTITSTIFKAVKNAGFDTVRIPVSWLSYIGSGSSYTISSSWMARVKEVVDMAIAADLYTVINVHGDGYSSVTGGWLLPGASDQTTIKAKFKAVWTQIATTFKDYDEHLIFEGMNEIGADANYDWETVNNYYTNINDYNQIFIDAVRATGGNNQKRWLIITGWNTNIDYTTNQWLNFTLPTDSYNSSPRYMISVHYYSPWEFCGNESYDVVNWGSSATSSVATWGNEDYMIEQIALCYDNFVSKGYPVFVGEFGCIDKSNSAMRCYWAETFVKLCKNNGCIPVWWDNGWNGSYGFALFDRSNGSQTQSAIISAMVNAMGSTSSGTTTTTTTQAPTTTTQSTTQATTTTTKATTTTTQSTGSSSNADNYVITINGTSALKYIVVNGYHLSVSDGSATYWENAAVSGGSATVYVPKANAYSLTIDFKSEQWGSAIASWSGNINSDITLTFNGSSVSASTGSAGTTTTTKATTTTTKATTTTTKATTTTTKATTTTTKATTTTTKATTTTTKATTTTTKATTTTTQASSSNSDNYAVTIKTTGNGSSLAYLMINGYHLSIAGGEGTYWENAAAGNGTVVYIPKAQSWGITIDFKTSEWGSSSASWSGTVTSDITLTFNGSTVSAS